MKRNVHNYKGLYVAFLITITIVITFTTYSGSRVTKIMLIKTCMQHFGNWMQLLILPLTKYRGFLFIVKYSRVTAALINRWESAAVSEDVRTL